MSETSYMGTGYFELMFALLIKGQQQFTLIFCF